MRSNIYIAIHDDDVNAVELAYQPMLSKLPFPIEIIAIHHTLEDTLSQPKYSPEILSHLIVLQDIMYVEDAGGNPDGNKEIVNPTGLKIVDYLINEISLEPYRIIVFANFPTEDHLKFIHARGLSFVSKDSFLNEIQETIETICDKKVYYRSPSITAKIKKYESIWLSEYKGDILAACLSENEDPYKIMYMRLAGQTYPVIVNILLLEAYYSPKKIFKDWLFNDNIPNYLAVYIKYLKEAISEINLLQVNLQSVNSEMLGKCKADAIRLYCGSAEGKRMSWEKLRQVIDVLEQKSGKNYIELNWDKNKISLSSEGLFESKMKSVHTAKSNAKKILNAQAKNILGQKGWYFDEIIELYWLLKKAKNATVQEIDENMDNLLC